MDNKSRLGFIGGSDAAAVLGLSRYKTPLQLWTEKTGNIVPDDRSAELPIRLGNKLESVVADLFTEETGKKVCRVNEYQIHPQYNFIRAQIDRRIIGEDEILECKTASGWKADEWADGDIPQEYLIQCLHQLAVTGRKRCYIACLIGGNQEFVWKSVERDDVMISGIIKREVEFWEKFVIPKQMPAVMAQDNDVLYDLFPHSDGTEVDISSLDDKINRSKEIDKELDRLEEEKEQIGNMVRAALGTASTGVSGRWKATWKEMSNYTRLDMLRLKSEAPDIYAKYSDNSPRRMLRISEIKKK